MGPKDEVRISEVDSLEDCLIHFFKNEDICNNSSFHFQTFQLIFDIESFRDIMITPFTTLNLHPEFARAAEEFHNRPQFDSVLIGDEPDQFYGLLLHLFTIKIGARLYELAQIQHYTKLRKSHIFGTHHLKLEDNAQVIHVSWIKQKIRIVPDLDSEKSYYLLN